MTDTIQPSSDLARRARLIGTAGWLIILLSAGSALLPFVDRAASSAIIGSLLLAAGVIEILAATQRKETRVPAMLAGAVTTLAGLLFLLSPVAKFFSTVTIVTAWLLVRAVILFVASRMAQGSVRRWIGLSAVTDVVLGVLLLAGLSIATLVVTMFGPTPTLLASFAWVFALSFVVTGMLLLEIASCQRESAGE